MSGFYHVTGTAGRAATAAMMRIYLNVRASHAPKTVQHVAAGLNEAGIRFTLKIVNSRQHLRRRDNTVVYVAEGDLDAALLAVQDATAPAPSVLNPETLLFTSKIADGISVAAEGLAPGRRAADERNWSFGESRSGFSLADFSCTPSTGVPAAATWWKCCATRSDKRGWIRTPIRAADRKGGTRMSTEDLDMPGLRSARVALVSMPWMSVDLPSIQLATLAAMLRRRNVDADTFHFFVDYAADIGPALYRQLSDATDYLNEYVFCRQYFRVQRNDGARACADADAVAGVLAASENEAVINAVGVLADSFLDRCVDATDWSSYDLVGFSLTIAQTAASMVLAQRIKARYPDVTIAFGGTSCAGPMGVAIAKACPHVDVVVRAEGELVLGELVSRLSQGRDWHDLPHLVWRTGSEVETSGPGDEPVFRSSELPSRELDYDDYFARISDRGIAGRSTCGCPSRAAEAAGTARRPSAGSAACTKS